MRVDAPLFFILAAGVSSPLPEQDLIRKLCHVLPGLSYYTLTAQDTITTCGPQVLQQARWGLCGFPSLLASHPSVDWHWRIPLHARSALVRDTEALCLVLGVWCSSILPPYHCARRLCVTQIPRGLEYSGSNAFPGGLDGLAAHAACRQLSDLDRRVAS